jgi:hypothetical protein
VHVCVQQDRFQLSQNTPLLACLRPYLPCCSVHEVLRTSDGGTVVLDIKYIE